MSSFVLNILNREGYCCGSPLYRSAFLFPLREAGKLIDVQLERQRLAKKRGAVGAG